MRNFNLISVFLFCSFSWISVSVSETVEVPPGQEVTLLCSNFSSSPTQIIWFRVAKGSKPRCVSSMYQPHEPASFCDGFKHGTFEVSSNMSTVFLKIKRVNSSDSGLYFCGYYVTNNPVIVDATHLEVQEAFDGITNLILGGLTVFLIAIIICLAVKIKKLHKAHVEDPDLQQTEGQGSDDLNYAAVTFLPKMKRNHRSAAQREVEPHAIYSATR